MQGRGSGKITATYRYNGLGHRITWHDDANASGLPPDGSDPVYHVVYTEDWRMLAVYRGTDSDPKERHVPHFAGLNGYGNAAPGGIDGRILRDKDDSTAWSAAADALDQRRYVCQNWRGDVVALLSDAGLLVESTRYTAYGEPISLPAGDADSDADWDSTDSTAILGYGGAYDARYDVNLDGNIDADDAGDALNLAGGGYLTTHGYGLVSRRSAGRAGYAGYEHDRVMPGFLTHVRHRAYRMDLGRFMQPDPLGYVDGVNRWGYVKQMPVAGADRDGLCEQLCGPWGTQPQHPKPWDYDPTNRQCAPGWYYDPSTHSCKRIPDVDRDGVDDRFDSYRMMCSARYPIRLNPPPTSRYGCWAELGAWITFNDPLALPYALYCARFADSISSSQCPHPAQERQRNGRRHCLLACCLAGHLGEQSARNILHKYECCMLDITVRNGGSGDWIDFREDWTANNMGIECARGITDSIDSHCMSCCPMCAW